MWQQAQSCHNPFQHAFTTLHWVHFWRAYLGVNQCKLFENAPQWGKCMLKWDVATRPSKMSNLKFPIYALRSIFEKRKIPKKKKFSFFSFQRGCRKVHPLERQLDATNRFSFQHFFYGLLFYKGKPKPSQLSSHIWGHRISKSPTPENAKRSGICRVQMSTS